MNDTKLASDILEKVGGNDNVLNVGHCATRLRFNLHDDAKADTDGIKSLKGVMGVVNKGGQYQVIIGNEVNEVFTALRNAMEQAGAPGQATGEDGAQPREDGQPGREAQNGARPGEGHRAAGQNKQEKKSPVAVVLDTIAGIFFPIVPALTGAGMLKALLSFLMAIHAINPASQTYQILNFMGDAGFYFLPIILAVSAAKKFHCSEYLAAFLGGILLHPSFTAMVGAAKQAGEGISFIGLPVSLVNYSSSVIPIILTVWFLSYVEPLVEKHIPKMVRMVIAPLVILLITAPASLIVIGPLGNIAGLYLGKFIEMVNGFAPWLVPTLVGALTPLMVMTGMHYGLIPIGINMLATTGYDTVAGPGMMVSNIAQGGASLGVAVRAKNPEIKSLAASVGITAVCGVTEPAMYGISMRFKRPLAAAMAGGGVAGLFMGIMGVGRYAQVAPGLFALPSYIGGNSMKIFYYACIACVIAFVVSFLISLILGINEEA